MSHGPRPNHSRSLETGRNGQQDTDAREIPQIGPYEDVVLDHEIVVDEPVHLTVQRVVPPSPPGDSMHDLDAIPPQVDALQPVRQAVETEREPACEHTPFTLGQQPQAVVVRGRAPELEPGAAEEGATAVPAQLRQQATLARDCGPHVLRLEDDDAALLAWPDATRCSRTLLPRRQRNLLPRDLVTGGSPVGRAAEKEPEGDEPLSAAASVGDVDPDRRGAARWDAELRQPPLPDHRAVLRDLPRAAQ